MYRYFIKKKADVISHWYSLIPSFNTSTREFYDAIEKELKERQVPGLEVFHIDFAEGGMLSQKREYLRMTRERLVFDICAAPFGNSYFFSCRFAEIPAVIQLWQLVVVLIASLVIMALALKFLGFILGTIVLFGGLVFLIYCLRNAVAIGLQDLDATLIKSPILGPIYENWFRKETYYREDTRLMYCDTVNAVVKAKVEETTGAKGIKLVRFNEYSPILGELYKPTTVSLPKEPS
ncbi:MAG: tripartite tricarboxylate transporter TctB family protein [Candidatus Paceibacterota bacterium]